MPAFVVTPPDPVVVIPWEGGEARIYPDDDAVAQALWLPSRVVERTRSGLLVVRDRATLAVLGRLVGSAPVEALAARDDEVLVALTDGVLGVLDPVTLAFRETARGEGVLVYLGDLGRRAVALFQTDLDARGPSWSLVGVLDGRRRIVRYHPRDGDYGFYESAPSAAQVGRAVLLSWDWGEFGGDAARIRPLAGRARRTRGSSALGFAEVAGRTIAYGGLEHMGLLSAFISDARTGRGLYSASSYLDFADEDPPPPPDRPEWPITAIAQVPGGDVVYVLTYDRLYQTDRHFQDWQPLGALEVSVHAGRAFSVGSTPSVTALHAEADGSLILGSDADGFLVRAPDGVVRAVAPYPRWGYEAGQLLSAPDGLYAAGLAGIERVGDPEWDPLWPKLDAGISGGWWDLDPEGRPRITGITGSELVAVTLGGGVERTTVPGVSPNTTDAGAVVGLEGRLLLGGSEVNRSWDGERWTSWPAADWFRFNFQQPRPVRGAADLVVNPRAATLYRVPAEGGAWEPVATEVVDALQSPRWGLVMVSEGSVVEDGCGRLWRIGQNISITDDSGTRELAPPTGLWTWRAAVARPEGVALGGVDLVVDLRSPC